MTQENVTPDRRVERLEEMVTNLTKLVELTQAETKELRKEVTEGYSRLKEQVDSMEGRLLNNLDLRYKLLKDASHFQYTLLKEQIESGNARIRESAQQNYTLLSGQVDRAQNRLYDQIEWSRKLLQDYRK